MSDIGERIKTLRSDIDAAQAQCIEHNTKVNLATEELARLMAELKTEFQLESLEEAQTMIEKIEKALEAKIVEIENWGLGSE